MVQTQVLEVQSSIPCRVMVLCTQASRSISICFHIHGAPWSAANRLHGQRTGSFHWHPVLRPSRKTGQFRLDPTQSCAPGRLCDRLSSPRTWKVLLHPPTCNQPLLALYCMPTNHHLSPCPHPTQRLNVSRF